MKFILIKKNNEHFHYHIESQRARRAQCTIFIYIASKIATFVQSKSTTKLVFFLKK